MNNGLQALLSIAMAIIGLAILSVVVSKKADTVGVIKAGADAFSGAMGTAMSPITGNGFGMY